MDGNRKFTGCAWPLSAPPKAYGGSIPTDTIPFNTVELTIATVVQILYLLTTQDQGGHTFRFVLIDIVMNCPIKHYLEDEKSVASVEKEPFTDPAGHIFLEPEKICGHVRDKVKCHRFPD